MQQASMLVLLISALGVSAFVQEKAFDWVPANNETGQLDPTDYHTGRVFRPGPDGGNIHVGIQAKQPVTIAMTWIEDWNAAQQHPENSRQLALSVCP